MRLATADRVVATGALAEGARNLGSWWKSFTKAVIVEARAAGLCEPRWTAAHRTVLAGAAVVPAVVVEACLAGYLPRTRATDRSAPSRSGLSSCSRCSTAWCNG
jgi:hypothetical protein